MTQTPTRTKTVKSDLDLRTIILPLVAIVVLIAYFSYINPLFFSSVNALNIGRQSSVLLIDALAGTVVILISSIDLSVGALVTLTGILAALTVGRFIPLAAAALQFVLAHPAIATNIPGTRSEKHMDQNVALIGTPIPAEFWAELKKQGLIRTDAPTPK